ncbi:MAG: hypothetical protein US39_C0007G0026 [Microgenomates group bacterium GW2011_GWC1_37_12b]|uniref:Uncharacterized protein n=2 Tax=Candidatus Woeseibacteriota TaxID=1752722 RepID=A0A0G0L976_9BACT|nr:MAG: hypothetical protein US39_C0007G0026 [Microgenomates group bacterium GW2011_GWC1_37_12b]KKQ87557.1 MAG: hypothetical protein UT10_C0004G0023 [Candidatus Woesebacteria bacterium GW2011_GWB1_38_8b]
MQDVFDKYLSVILGNAGISNTESETLKREIYVCWLVRVGRRLDSKFTSRQKEIINEMQASITEESFDEEKMRKYLKEYFNLSNSDNPQNIEDVKVFSEEAEKIVTQLLDTYFVNASPGKIDKVKRDLQLISK